MFIMDIQFLHRLTVDEFHSLCKIRRLVYKVDNTQLIIVVAFC